MGKAEETEFKKPELLNDILEETEELIKIFVTSIKTAVRQAHGPEQSRRAASHCILSHCGVLHVRLPPSVARLLRRTGVPSDFECLVSGDFPSASNRAGSPRG